MDEVASLRSVFRKFCYRKLSVIGRRLLLDGVEELKRITNSEYWGVFHLFGRTQCVPHSTFTLVLANGGGHPLVREVLVLDERGKRFLLPYRKREDFFALASLLGIQSVRGYATLVAFVEPSLDGFQKIVPPTQIQNAADAEAFALIFPDTYTQYVEGNNSLWVGSDSRLAYLYMLTLDTQQTPPYMTVTFIDPETKYMSELSGAR